MKKTLKVLLALLLVFSLVTPAAFAAEEPEVKKVYTVGENVLSPEVTFEFKLEGVDPTADENVNGQPVVKGVEGLLKFKDDVNTLTFTEGGENTLPLEVVKGTNAPGIYKYQVTETKGSVEGLVYDETEYTVYLYLLADGTHQFVIYNGEEKATLDFTNVYAHEDEGGLLHNLTVAKTVTGNLGDQNKDFNFTITITPDETVAGQQFVVKKGTDTVATLNSENNYTLEVTLKHDESVVVYGLSENDNYTVVEAESNKDGYTTTGEVTDATAMGSKDKTITVTNEANQEIPTGIIENIAPFALVLVAAVAFGFVYFKKRSVEA